MKRFIILLPVLAAIPIISTAGSHITPDGRASGFRAEVEVNGGTYTSVTRPFWGVSSIFAYAIKKAPLEFSLGLGGSNTSGTICTTAFVRILGLWPLGRVSPFIAMSGGWSFQLPSTNEVSVSSDPEFGWNRTYIPSSATCLFGEDGPFGELSAGAAIKASVHEIRLGVGFGYSVCYEGVWGKDSSGRAVRYGIIEKFENYPGIGSRYVWTEGRGPMKPIPRLRLQISFSF